MLLLLLYYSLLFIFIIIFIIDAVLLIMYVCVECLSFTGLKLAIQAYFDRKNFIFYLKNLPSCYIIVFFTSSSSIYLFNARVLFSFLLLLHVIVVAFIIMCVYDGFVMCYYQ